MIPVISAGYPAPAEASLMPRGHLCVGRDCTVMAGSVEAELVALDVLHHDAALVVLVRGQQLDLRRPE